MQESGPDLLEQTVLRWVDSTSVEKLRGIRFIMANPTVMWKMGDASREITEGLESLAAYVASEYGDGRRLLLVRMAFLSINSAVMAANGTECTDDEIVSAAREHALALIGLLDAS
jgi:hypothetical protein